MLTRRTFGMMLAVLPCAVATSGPVTAESYPTRPIKLIVPQAAGGPTDSSCPADRTAIVGRVG